MNNITQKKKCVITIINNISYLKKNEFVSFFKWLSSIIKKVLQYIAVKKITPISYFLIFIYNIYYNNKGWLVLLITFIITRVHDL